MLEQLEIDKESVDFIVTQEVSSPAYYARHYRRPEWPGGASGITIACGYDLGYASPSKIRSDWEKHVSEDMLRVMVSCSGVKGAEAQALLPKVKNQIDIPWDAAYDVFIRRDVPQWTIAVKKRLPNCDKLSPLCLGMHVSTAYNRGDGGYDSTAPRFAEMHNIKRDMASGNLRDIGDQFLAMRRLWPNMRGLRDRYTQTAALWNKGLSQPVRVPPAIVIDEDPSVPLNAGPARTKPPVTSTAQNTSTGGLVAGTVTVAKHAADNGADTGTIVAVLVSGLILAGVLWFAWYRNRNPK